MVTTVTGWHCYVLFWHIASECIFAVWVWMTRSSGWRNFCGIACTMSKPEVLLLDEQQRRHSHNTPLQLLGKDQRVKIWVTLKDKVLFYERTELHGSVLQWGLEGHGWVLHCSWSGGLSWISQLRSLKRSPVGRWHTTSLVFIPPPHGLVHCRQQDRLCVFHVLRCHALLTI